MTPQKAFNQQRNAAKQRGIPFLLTFDEWWKIWHESGHWNERGRRKGQYAMSRREDSGPYTADNVRIVTVGDNLKEFWNDDNRVKVSERFKGVKLSEDHKVKISEAAIKQHADPEKKERHREACQEHWQSPEGREMLLKHMEEMRGKKS